MILGKHHTYAIEVFSRLFLKKLTYKRNFTMLIVIIQMIIIVIPLKSYRDPPIIEPSEAPTPENKLINPIL